MKRDPQPLPFADLGRVGQDPLWAGGVGEIRALLDRPQLLLKTYPTVPVDQAGQVALIEWALSLGRADAAHLDACASWPVRIVPETPWGPGVVLPRAPKRFMLVVAGTERTRDLQYAYVPAARFSGGELLSPTGAIALTFNYARLLDLLHRGGIVYGDLSHANALWGGRPRRPDLYLIDCDGAWRTTGPRPLPPAETPGWIDPWPGDRSPEAEKRRDLWKLSLLFVRLYYRSLGEIDASRPLVELPATPMITESIHDLLLAGLRRDGVRPEAAEWVPALQRLHGLMGRQAAA